MKVRAISISLLMAVVFSGCTLDEVNKYGDKCSPDGDETRMYSRIYTDNKQYLTKESADLGMVFQDAFNKGLCPAEYAQCAKTVDDSTFACMIRCDRQSQIVCDGKCIDPSSDSEYCGAVNDCAKDGYGCCRGGVKCASGEYCINGMCQLPGCEEGSVKCDNGATYKCVRHSGDLFSFENDILVYDIEKACPLGLCLNDQVCDTGECIPGQRICKDGYINVCQDNGHWENVERCRSGVCNSDELTCEDVKCIDGAKKCLNNALMICRDSVWTKSHVCTTACDSATYSCTSCKLGESRCTQDGVFQKCVNNQWDEGENCSKAGKNCYSDGCFVCKNEKTCDGSVVKVCENGEWQEKEDCAAKSGGYTCFEGECRDVKNQCTLGEHKCDSGLYYICESKDGANSWLVQENCLAAGKACVKDSGCRKPSSCENNVLTMYDANDVAVKTNCSARQMVCDLDVNDCVNPDSFECDDAFSAIIMKYKTKQVKYECGENAGLSNEEIRHISATVAPDLYRSRIFCNPLEGCSHHVCKGSLLLVSNEIAEGEGGDDFTVDEAECGFFDEICSQKFSVCVACDPDGGAYCDESGDWYPACTPDSDTGENKVDWVTCDKGCDPKKGCLK